MRINKSVPAIKSLSVHDPIQILPQVLTIFQFFHQIEVPFFLGHLRPCCMLTDLDEMVHSWHRLKLFEFDYLRWVDVDYYVFVVFVCCRLIVPNWVDHQEVFTIVKKHAFIVKSICEITPKLTFNVHSINSSEQDVHLSRLEQWLTPEISLVAVFKPWTLLADWNTKHIFIKVNLLRESKFVKNLLLTFKEGMESQLMHVFQNVSCYSCICLYKLLHVFF